VQYRPDLSHIWCACHNGHFDLNGKNISGPPPRPLESFAVNARGSQIVVSKST
jgi:Rieske Fe-S protein